MTTFTRHTLKTATGQAKTVLDDINGKYGFIPELFAYMAEAPDTVTAYVMLNELVSNTSLTAAQQQIALLAASVENDCEFCIVAHRAFGKFNKVSEKTLTAIVNGEEIDDAKENALVKFTRTIVSTRGRPGQAALNEFFAAGFSKQQIFEVILVVTIKTLSNYANHLTLPEPNKELLAML